MHYKKLFVTPVPTLIGTAIPPCNVNINLMISMYVCTLRERMLSDLETARGRVAWAINAYQRHNLGKMFFHDDKQYQEEDNSFITTNTTKSDDKNHHVSFPSDLLASVFVFLPWQTLACSIPLVSQQWNQMCSGNEVWENVYLRHWLRPNPSHIHSTTLSSSLSSSSSPSSSSSSLRLHDTSTTSTNSTTPVAPFSLRISPPQANNSPIPPVAQVSSSSSSVSSTSVSLSFSSPQAQEKLLQKRNYNQLYWRDLFREKQRLLRLRMCPLIISCGGGAGSVVPILYGYPSVSLVAAARAGRVVIGLDHIPVGPWHFPVWACTKCNRKWRLFPWESSEHEEAPGGMELIPP